MPLASDSLCASSAFILSIRELSLFFHRHRGQLSCQLHDRSDHHWLGLSTSSHFPREKLLGCCERCSTVPWEAGVHDETVHGWSMSEYSGIAVGRGRGPCGSLWAEGPWQEQHCWPSRLPSLPFLLVVSLPSHCSLRVTPLLQLVP